MTAGGPSSCPGCVSVHCDGGREGESEVELLQGVEWLKEGVEWLEEGGEGAGQASYASARCSCGCRELYQLCISPCLQTNTHAHNLQCRTDSAHLRSVHEELLLLLAVVVVQALQVHLHTKPSGKRECET